MGVIASFRCLGADLGCARDRVPRGCVFDDSGGFVDEFFLDRDHGVCTSHTDHDTFLGRRVLVCLATVGPDFVAAGSVSARDGSSLPTNL